MKIKTVKYAINLTYVGYFLDLTRSANKFNRTYHVKKSTNIFYTISKQTYYYNTTRYPDIYCVYRLYKNADITMEYGFMSKKQNLCAAIRASL